MPLSSFCASKKQASSPDVKLLGYNAKAIFVSGLVPVDAIQHEKSSRSDVRCQSVLLQGFSVALLVHLPNGSSCPVCVRLGTNSFSRLCVKSAID